MDESGLRAWAGRWPGVSSGIKWQDDLMFSVGGKMFCVLGAHGPQAGAVRFKVDEHRVLELTGQPGIVPAPYLARAHGVQPPRQGALPDAVLHGFIRRSDELVREKLPMRRQHELAD